MGGDEKAPPPPDPKQTAAAQTGTNIGTAIAQQALNSTNQVTPYGSLTYSVTGSQTYKDPYTGKSYELPTYTATTALSPEQQALYDQQVGIRGGLNESAQGIIGSGVFDSNVDLSREGLDKYITNNFQDDFNSQWDTNRSSLETTLANKGLKLGSAAYDKAIQDFETSRGGAYDNFLGNMYSNARSNVLGERGQTLNELSTFLTGGQQANPTFQNTPQTNVNGTDVAGLINQGYQNQLSAYQASQANQNGIFDAIGQLAGTAISALPSAGWALSDERLKTDTARVGEVEIDAEHGEAQLPVFAYRLKDGAEKRAIGPLHAMGKSRNSDRMGGGLMQLGVMAQDVEKVMPEAVARLPSGYRAVDYERIARALK